MAAVTATARALTLLEALFRNPFLTVAGMSVATGFTISNANSLAARLVDLGILEEATGQRRNRAFVYREYLDMFEDKDEAEPDRSP